MSFILDALRKAERDRNLGQAPGLQDVAMAPDDTRRKAESPQPMPRLLVLAGLVLLVCLGLYLIFRPQHETRPAPPLPPGKITATVRGPAPPPSGIGAETQEPAQTEEALAPAIDASANLASLDDLTGSNPPSPVATPAAAPEPEPQSDFVVHPEPPRGANFRSETPIPGPSATAPETPEASMRSSAFDQPAAPTSAAAAPANATALESMPQSYQAAFPTFSVDVHVWDSNPQKRFVLVNGRRYREGDTLTAGPKLVEIAQQGLIVDYNGERVLVSIAQ
ncbi:MULTISPECIES: general secretion pathway protein GspB [Hydrocarboniphaga]|jgi:general secretion pathway protein B|uniref:Type II secretion system protein GspB C-terminal domain-containing protein n=1 Tax=Hydrocarboniphaga effusa AP103 TaxID=1172194 RepID=I7ZET0_9GAMM|nr:MULTISPECIES: general secretion pathway protein GspB [Hydrocarboniphaga]EIT70404.1 hypothetical protein WQQ_05410 [Hydrocarboniphaga effusa AP103]MDZ4078337.1 general secretion pathway protein GspB [Hydrocarboniphaga sp.]